MRRVVVTGLGMVTPLSSTVEGSWNKLINSISGLFGQLTKNYVFIEVSNYWYLVLAVIIGGQIGNFLNLKVFSSRILTFITSSLVLFVSIRIGMKLFF